MDTKIIGECADQGDTGSRREATRGEVETAERRDQQDRAAGGLGEVGKFECGDGIIGVGCADNGLRRAAGTVGRAGETVGGAQGENRRGVGEHSGCGEEGKDCESVVGD